MLIFFDKAARPLWEGKPSIYGFIREQGEQVSGVLPDDEEFWAGSKYRWVAGGLDGAFGHHGGAGGQPEELQELVQLLAKLSRNPKASTRKAVYARLMKADVGQMDNLLDGIRKHPGVKPDRLFQEAVWFAGHAAHRNVVKCGIALMGLFENEEVKELLLTLGRHEEFTLYAAVAIMNGMEEWNEALFELAKQVHGWGKIHVVERLEPSTPEIQAWLLRHGCRNSVMNEYLACICARKGGLHEALSGGHGDKELFDGATDIMGALLQGGPAEDMDDYEHAPQAVSGYLELAREMCSTSRHLSVMLDLCGFLEENERWTARLSAGWTEECRAAQQEACRTLIADSKWGSAVMNDVCSGASVDRFYGVLCAEKMGMDIWELLFEQLALDPLQDFHLFQLMKTDDPERVGRLVQWASRQLPLGQIASGPAEESGFGEAYAAHRCLDTILQSLDRFPGVGRDLIVAGLHSPVIRNRNMAVLALENWPLDAWGDRVREAVLELPSMEPDGTLKERIGKLRETNGLL